MTSMQIAETTGKLHKDVLRAIRNMESAWIKVNGRKFALVEYTDAKGEKRPCYQLTKTECLYIATKFNDEARARLILRWEELENEKLAAQQQQPKDAEVLPPPISNTLSNSELVEVVDEKAVTTSRKIAKLLGREHGSVLETIKDNLHRREFKYGNFTVRKYSDGRSGHGYEFLITQKGLSVLAGLMRYNAKEKIAEAYKNAWHTTPAAKALPAAATPALPALAGEAATDCSTDDEIPCTPKLQKYIDWLEKYNENLCERLRKAKETMRMYEEMYSSEKAKRSQNENRAAYWHDLYEDLMLRAQCIEDIDAVIAAHIAFKKRISGR